MKISLSGCIALLSLTLSGCNSISSAEREGVEKNIRYIHSSNDSFKFETSKVSDGVVQGQPYRLVKVSYTDPANASHPRQCAYVLYHLDSEAGMLTGIETSLGNQMDGTCSVQMGCFGCNDGKFLERLKERGYTGKVEDL